MSPEPLHPGDDLVPALRSLAGSEERPPHDVVRAAMRRVRARRSGVSSLNEILGVFASLGRGIALLLGAERPKRGPHD